MTKPTLSFGAIELLARFAQETTKKVEMEEERTFIEELHKVGMIESEHTKGYRATPKGMAFMNYVSKLPLPSQQWTMPS